MNFRQPRIGVSLVAACVLLATPTAAQAKQFTKLLQLRQVVPGNDQVVTNIVEPTIGQDGQVAVLLKTETVEIDPGPPGRRIPTTSQFKGIYAISKTGVLRLVEGGSSRVGYGTANRQEFSAPSISEGKIAYLSIKQSENRLVNPGIITPRATDLRVGKPGNIKTVLSLQLSTSQASSEKTNLLFVNGKAYFIDSVFAKDGVFKCQDYGVVGLVNTLAPMPRLSILTTNPPCGSNEYNGEIRASAQTLLLSKSISFPGGVGSSSVLLENLGDGRFVTVPVGEALPGNCGFSASLENIVACSGYQYNSSNVPVLSVRFGLKGKFNRIPLPPSGYPGLSSIANPAISNRSVIFQASESRPFDEIPTATVTVETIYLSQNGQAPISLIDTTKLLDGKIIGKLSLNQNGRTIAGNSAVFTASFIDGTTALYRVDF